MTVSMVPPLTMAGTVKIYSRDFGSIYALVHINMDVTTESGYHPVYDKWICPIRTNMRVTSGSIRVRLAC